ncbi:YchJ family protein [Streptomyces formicae]|uniref:UPF0225 protein J4032_14195 n=1 Tax=Streptomyces formicae TaxID=1616117 RepID=A0ABY3WIX8_9ACTN|nr:YchJ family metal-binding protein [Streptomyces formicae]UNM12528.1 hypothetical protein J4032_14195 [Streptomyces formicae]
MSRRPTRPARPARPTVTAESSCPCGLPAAYGACCGRFHDRRSNAQTAELLMRSRYCAFVLCDEAYLLRTWNPATRPGSVDFDPAMRWSGLEIVATTDGSMFHTSGSVTFVARYTHDGQPGALRERSRFERADGAWMYVDGTFEE